MLLKVAFLFAPVLLVGCGEAQPYVSEARLRHGLVIVLPGIEGRSPWSQAICRGLDNGGVNWAIELHDWTTPGALLYNLRAEARNREKAEELADRIVRYSLSHPGRPVLLVGQSGGGAIAAWTVGAMPPDQKIDGVIMLATALSPGYILDSVLSRTRRGVVSFYSERDWMLGAGTQIAGTMDGEHTASAGKTGFDVPSADNRPEAYRKLFQIPWKKEMADTGHLGGHLTSSARKFVATYVAPFVWMSLWDDWFVQRVLNGEAAWITSQPVSMRGGGSFRSDRGGNAGGGRVVTIGGREPKATLR